MSCWTDTSGRYPSVFGCMFVFSLHISTSIHISMSVHVSVHMSTCQYICQYICIAVHPSIYPSGHPRTCMYLPGIYVSVSTVFCSYIQQLAVHLCLYGLSDLLSISGWEHQLSSYHLSSAIICSSWMGTTWETGVILYSNHRQTVVIDAILCSCSQCLRIQ